MKKIVLQIAVFLFPFQTFALDCNPNDYLKKAADSYCQEFFGTSAKKYPQCRREIRCSQRFISDHIEVTCSHRENPTGVYRMVRANNSCKVLWY